MDEIAAGSADPDIGGTPIPPAAWPAAIGEAVGSPPTGGGVPGLGVSTVAPGLVISGYISIYRYLLA